MTQLLLIRHGQASFGAADYDRLSDVGRRQARLVGRQLAARGQRFDVLIAGDMQRQRHTAELAVQGLNGHGQNDSDNNDSGNDAPQTNPPALAIDPAFNEYDADALFAAYLPRVLAEDPALAARRDEINDDRRLFQKAFEQVTGHWLAGTPPEGRDCETWQAFTDRVTAALDRLRNDHPRDSRIGVFTSGGPIAVAVATAVAADAHKTIEINWGVYNTGISELRSTRSGWRLLGFNDISALRAAGDAALITHR